MDKSPDAFRTISEVAEWLGTPTHVLRFWESRFTQVKPVKRAGGRRYYRPADMKLLGGIKRLLHDDGMTIRGVQKLLREEGVKHVAAMSGPLDHGDILEGELSESPEELLVKEIVSLGDAPSHQPMSERTEPVGVDNIVPLGAAPVEAEPVKTEQPVAGIPEPDEHTPAPVPPADDQPVEELQRDDELQQDDTALEDLMIQVEPEEAPQGGAIEGSAALMDSEPEPPEPETAAQTGDAPPEPEEQPAEPDPVAPEPLPILVDVPDDPADNATFASGEDLVMTIRNATQGGQPVAAAPETLADIYQRLTALRERMQDGSEDRQTD